MFHYGDVVWLDFDPSGGHEQRRVRRSSISSPLLAETVSDGNDLPSPSERLERRSRIRRPAVVVSNDAYNRYNNLVMVVPITSNREYPLHVNVGSIQTEDGGLIQGWAEVEQLKSLDLEYRRAAKVGQLDDDPLRRVTDLILGCLMEPTMRLERLTPGF